MQLTPHAHAAALVNIASRLPDCGNTPPGCKADPDDDNLDALTDLANAIESRIKLAFRQSVNRGVSVTTCDVEAEDVPTIPRTGRKKVTLYLRCDVQVDGDDDVLGDMADEVADELRIVFDRV